MVCWGGGHPRGNLPWDSQGCDKARHQSGRCPGGVWRVCLGGSRSQQSECVTAEEACVGKRCKGTRFEGYLGLDHGGPLLGSHLHIPLRMTGARHGRELGQRSTDTGMSQRSSRCRRATGGMAEQRQGWQDWRHELRFIVCRVLGFAQPWGSPCHPFCPVSCGGRGGFI